MNHFESPLPDPTAENLSEIVLPSADSDSDLLLPLGSTGGHFLKQDLPAVVESLTARLAELEKLPSEELVGKTSEELLECAEELSRIAEFGERYVEERSALEDLEKLLYESNQFSFSDLVDPVDVLSRASVVDGTAALLGCADDSELPEEVREVFLEAASQIADPRVRDVLWKIAEDPGEEETLREITITNLPVPMTDFESKKLSSLLMRHWDAPLGIAATLKLGQAEDEDSIEFLRNLEKAHPIRVGAGLRVGETPMRVAALCSLFRRERSFTHSDLIDSYLQHLETGQVPKSLMLEASDALKWAISEVSGSVRILPYFQAALKGPRHALFVLPAMRAAEESTREALVLKLLDKEHVGSFGDELHDLVPSNRGEELIARLKSVAASGVHPFRAWARSLTSGS